MAAMDFTGDYLRGYSGNPAAEIGQSLNTLATGIFSGIEQGKVDHKAKLTDRADYLGKGIKFALANKDEASAAAMGKELQSVMRELHGSIPEGSISIQPTQAPAGAAPAAAPAPSGAPSASLGDKPFDSHFGLQGVPQSLLGSGVFDSHRSPLTLGNGGMASFERNPFDLQMAAQPDVSAPQIQGGNPLQMGGPAQPEAPAAVAPDPTPAVPAAAPAPAAAAPSGQPFAAYMQADPETAGQAQINVPYLTMLSRMAHADPKFQEVPAYGSLVDPESGKVVFSGGAKPQDLATANWRNVRTELEPGKAALAERKAQPGIDYNNAKANRANYITVPGVGLVNIGNGPSSSPASAMDRATPGQSQPAAKPSVVVAAPQKPAAAGRGRSGGGRPASGRGNGNVSERPVLTDDNGNQYQVTRQGTRQYLHPGTQRQQSLAQIQTEELNRAPRDRFDKIRPEDRAAAIQKADRRFASQGQKPSGPSALDRALKGIETLQRSGLKPGGK